MNPISTQQDPAHARSARRLRTIIIAFAVIEAIGLLLLVIYLLNRK